MFVHWADVQAENHKLASHRQCVAVSSNCMKLFKPWTFILVFILVSCKNSIAKVVENQSDTSKVIELAIRTAFYHQNLPGISSLKKNYHFKDSILFTSDSLSLFFLPQSVDSINFKILPKRQICSLFTTEGDLNKVPNYLYIDTFEKSDTGYYVSLESLNCFPFSGGGKIGIYITKEKDSFIVKNKMSSSIN